MVRTMTLLIAAAAAIACTSAATICASAPDLAPIDLIVPELAAAAAGPGEVSGERPCGAAAAS